MSCLLPEPLRPADCLLLLENEDGTESDHEPEAVLRRVGRGHKAARRCHFDYLQHRHRFVMVPDTASPRALLPSGSTSREERPLLRPRATSATSWRRVELAAAPLLRFAAAKLMNAPIELATHAPSNLTRELTQLFPEHRLGFFLGNPYNYLRPALHVFLNGDLVAIGKFADNDELRRRISREWDMLLGLKSVRGLAGSIPRPITYHHGHLGETLITDAFPAGDPAPIELTTPVRAWLRSCQQPRMGDAAQSALVRRLTAELAEVAGADELLSSVVHSALLVLAGTLVPVTLVHGDFVPWNMMLAGGTLQVFDWEYGCLEGLPGWDEAHFMLQVGLISHRWSRHEVVSALKRASGQSMLSLDPAQHRAVMAMVVVQLVLRYLDANNHGAATLLRGVAEDLMKEGWFSG